MTIGATISSHSATPIKKTGGTWLLFFAILSAALPILGSYGSGFGWWNFSFGLLAVAAAVPIAAIVILFVSIQILRKKTKLRGKTGLAMVIAVSVLAITGYWIRAGMIAPPIHDITTNLANPPAFQKLTVRADNLIGVDTVENWKTLHRKSYPDIRPILLNMPPDRAMTLVKTAIVDRGWAIALATPNRIEATDTVSPFKFKDDIAIIITATPTGGSEIQMRSISRVGVSDLGVNASRLRALTKDVKTAAGITP